MVDTLASADDIVASLASLLLEGEGSNICGVPVISRAFLRSVPTDAHDTVLYLKESGRLQGWKLSRRRRLSTACTEISSIHAAGGGTVQRLRVPGLSKPDFRAGGFDRNPRGREAYRIGEDLRIKRVRNEF
jgi:hypothetical protein